MRSTQAEQDLRLDTRSLPAVRGAAGARQPLRPRLHRRDMRGREPDRQREYGPADILPGKGLPALLLSVPEPGGVPRAADDAQVRQTGQRHRH